MGSRLRIASLVGTLWLQLSASAEAQLPFEGAADLKVAGVTRAAGLSAADFDGDGRIDLAVLSGDTAQLMILLNGAFTYRISLGGGRFSSGHSLPCASVASRICVADVNGDGAPDLVVGTWEEAKVYIWFGKNADP